jgi:hypothetical protein
VHCVYYVSGLTWNMTAAMHITLKDEDDLIRLWLSFAAFLLCKGSDKIATQCIFILMFNEYTLSLFSLVKTHFCHPNKMQILFVCTAALLQIINSDLLNVRYCIINCIEISG